MRNLQEQVKKAFCHQKLFWPFTDWINCSSDLKFFANSRSLEQIFLTVGQNNLGNKILIFLSFDWLISAHNLLSFASDITTIPKNCFWSPKYILFFSAFDYKPTLFFFNAVGETTNLMQIDTQKFLDLSLYLNLVWTSPLQIVLAMYFLWQILGPSSLAGIVRWIYQNYILRTINTE